jgi:hypothetical protein
VDFGRPQFDGFQLDAPHPLAVVDPPERHPETATRSITKTVHAATEENRMITASFTGNQEESKCFARRDAPNTPEAGDGRLPRVSRALQERRPVRKRRQFPVFKGPGL